MTKYLHLATVVSLLTCAPALAQQTTGNITGRVFDQQQKAVPGATVTAKNPATGFARTETSDSAGIYRLAALPIGVYDITAELMGFTTATKPGVEVNVAQTHAIDFDLTVGPIVETVNVVGGAPIISTTSSSVGEVVDLTRVRSLPLNGRQFASLAATIPGVGLGVLVDPTKQGANLAPQINGGNGRNVNFIVDGGDNNDDTVGGQLQQFPLEAIQEFNFQTQRFKAEFGRSNGGVMTVVTKSGTNMYAGSLFELFRDKSMAAETQTEKNNAPAGQDPTKGNYQRNQFGGSFGGPIVQDRVHFFVAFERTVEEKTQAMSAATQLLFPTLTGAYAVQLHDYSGIGKVDTRLNSAQLLSVRYGRNVNHYADSVASTRTPDNWGDGSNIFDSISLNHNWVIGGSSLNELTLQFADFRNTVTPRSANPNMTFVGVQTGANLGAPQKTEQHKFQVRDDFSWHVTGRGGLGHDFKTGVNFIYQPHLFITNNGGKGILAYTMAAGAPGCGCSTTVANVTGVILQDGDANVNLPNKQYGLYFQDDWRVSDRLTLNLGVRYDLVTGLNIDQSANPNFVKVQQAAQAGAFDGKIESLAGFGLSPEADKNNIQPRIGAVYDLRGNGRDILRGGWGIYTDFGYTNSNVLVPALDASGSFFGPVFLATNGAGLRNPDNSFYQVGQPITNLTNQVSGAAPLAPLLGGWADPRLQQPYQIQTNLGWSHQLTSDTSLSVDYVNSLGRDLNYRPRLNQINTVTGLRRISELLPSNLSPNSSSSRPAMSVGKSLYNALIVGVRRRMSMGIDLSGSYTLSESLSTIGNASDELNTANIQDPTNPFDAPAQFGPNLLTDARHRITISAVFQLPYDVQVAPIFFFRSALPVNLRDGRDLNADGDVLDLPGRAFAVETVETGVDDTGKEFAKATIEDMGVCQTVNCGRSRPQSQLNLRISKVFRLSGHVNIEAIGEIYNVFNTLNPATVNTTVNSAGGVQLANLLQPTSFSGDAGRPEQRLGQIGFRVTF